ncbi:cell envelope biogenesis protein LolA [Malaciobacter mytili LMG 24559]|uniref:Cell envelope biogenesis protein LolA n=1 Tax=Malaciobacter mytili LMG 24559 TaxID=1032238 RepID=A0AAX2AHK2_9BACT|nr:LolA-like outer membrane lipoprotein chaperone [Malaciobacter mytili]AXH15264.1 periplasmic outer membrane-specific lipoprotein chaperone [Malaciobacter mytili LMG 24559]RXK15664.1 cell envelope biogenesis protein LolA [Malaciobacter mytili LMG 24559]
MFYRFIFILGLFFSFLNANIFTDIKSFKAQFIQTITNSSSSNIEYKGEVFIKSNGKILWKYKTPVIKNVYINQNFAIVDEPELEQAIFTSLEREINIIKLLNNAKKIDENNYKAKVYNIEYNIFVKNNQISSISYSDELENKVLISFFDIQQNIVIDDMIFKFAAPDYYDIIRK